LQALVNPTDLEQGNNSLVATTAKLEEAYLQATIIVLP